MTYTQRRKKESKIAYLIFLVIIALPLMVILFTVGILFLIIKLKLDWQDKKFKRKQKKALQKTMQADEKDGMYD